MWSASAGDRSNPHVVLVHGSLDRSAGLLKLSRRLDDRFSVTRYDRRGYGRSLDLGGPFHMDAQVADLVEVIGAIGGGDVPCVVVGHSYGGNVALATAARHPSLIAGVVVYEAPLSWLPWWPQSTAGADARAWQHDPEEAAERFMRRLVGDARWERLPASTRRARRAEGPALIGELSDLREHAPWEPEAVAAAVLPMCGEGGLPHHRRSAEALGEWFGVEPIVLADARHFGPNTHPDAMGEVVAAFVSGVLA